MATVDPLGDVAERIAQLEAEANDLKADRDRLIAQALAKGYSIRQVAKMSGVSKSRVDQINRGVPR